MHHCGCSIVWGSPSCFFSLLSHRHLLCSQLPDFYHKKESLAETRYTMCHTSFYKLVERALRKASSDTDHLGFLMGDWPAQGP